MKCCWYEVKIQTIFDTSFLIKKLHLSPIWTGKYGFAKFFIFGKYSTTMLTHSKIFYFVKSKKKTMDKITKSILISSKIVCPRSRWLRWHCVDVDIDYMDVCCNSCCLRGHSFGVVVNNADIISVRSPGLCGHGHWTRLLRHFRKTLKASHRF